MFLSLVLADYGASVVRIDRPVAPFGPPRDTLCRHKRSIVIDFKKEPSRHAFLEFVKQADILIDPYRPGVMDRLGLGSNVLRELNPRLIYAHLYGFRPDGKYGLRAGHDINYLAVSGVLSLLGRKDEVPAPPSNVLGDFAGGGLVCVTGILLALTRRSITGKGQVVTANMVDGTTYLATFLRQQKGHQNMDKPRGENLLDGAAPFYEVYRTKDERFVAVGAQEPQFYAELLAGLKLDSKNMPAQWDRTQWPRTKQLFARIFREKTIQEWTEIFDHTDGCVSPVLHMEEIEKPFRPLVELSESPSLDVAVQEEYPELKRNEGWEEAVREWIPHMNGRIKLDAQAQLLVMQRETVL